MFDVNLKTLLKENIQLVIEERENYISERIELNDGNNWIPIIGSNEGQGTLNFSSKDVIYSKPLTFRKRTRKKIYYELNDDDFLLNLDYCLEDDNIIHIRYKLSNNREMFLSKILVNYAILIDKNPDYTWVPHFRYKKRNVIGDHVFRSPAIIYKKDKHSVAFIPDLKTLGQNRPFQTFMDFNLKSEQNNGVPQISYGFGNYVPSGHIFFKHNPKSEWKIEAGTDLTFRYYIIVFNDKTVQEVLEFLTNFFWQKYGSKLVFEDLNPQILPYETNVQEGIKAILDRHKFWCNFKINDKECGGFWQRSWIGKNKEPIKFIKPNELQEIFEQHSNIQRIAQVWNNAWFLNVRSGYGFRYFGELWNNKDLIDKGNRSLNTILNLPRIKGIFPSVILPTQPNTSTISTVNGLKAFLYTKEFHVVDSCLAMYWALKFYQDFGEKKDDILMKCKELVDLIESIQLDNGAIPTYILFEVEIDKPIISNDLINSASSGAPLMFLLEYFKIFNDNRIISICKRIANYIEKEVIPEDKWHDFEPFYSCVIISQDTYDNYTKSNIMNTLSIYWCAEGFKELFKVTNNKNYLKTGERILATLSLFQQVWNMPYISINTFGGFGVQNADAELNDARQGLFVRTYMEYYLETGKSEYMERGIAALRASWALQLLKEYEEQCPGNLGGIETLDGIDRGCVCENYGHFGKDERVSGYIMFDWGVGSAISATAYVKKHFGDLFIDFKEHFVFGIDGILVKKFEFLEEKILIEIELIPLKKNMLIKSRDAPEKEIEIVINNQTIGKFNKIRLDNGFKFTIKT
ncbi:MAG: hypothetical protein ACFFAO_03870 [Candidatus Hermodarchaeota archaeon]